MSNQYLNNKTFESIIESFQSSKRKKIRCELMLQDLRDTSDRRVRKYGDNNKEELVVNKENEYNQACDFFKVYQEQLAYAFYLLSENIANYARFQGIDVDDAIQEGVLICFEKIDRFDPRKGKAFNYMTTCILNHYRQIYRSIRNYNELKKRYGVFLQDKLETFLRNRVSSGHGEFENYDNSDSGN